MLSSIHGDHHYQISVHIYVSECLILEPKNNPLEPSFWKDLDFGVVRPRTTPGPPQPTIEAKMERI